MPEALVEIDFADPTGAFSGTDVTAYLRTFDTDRGRSNELDQQQAGTATIVLDNRDGRFDPANRSGAYWPNVLPMRRVRISALVDDGVSGGAYTVRDSYNREDPLRAGIDTYPIFTGFVESWAQEWDASNAAPIVTLHAVDGFKVLNLSTFDYGLLYNDATNDFSCGAGSDVVPDFGPDFIPDDLTGDRILTVLDCIDWPLSETELDAGTVTILGSENSLGGTRNFKYDDVNALSHLLQIADTEGGWLYMNELGQLRFIDADHIPALDPYDVFGGDEAGGEQGFVDVAGPFDDSRLYNVAVIASTHSVSFGTITVPDDVSQAHYYERSKTLTLLPVDAERHERAAELLFRYREPHLRLEPFTLRAKTEGGWRRFFRKHIADLIRVRKRPSVADDIERDARIEGISVSMIDRYQWVGSWALANVLDQLLTFDQVSPESPPGVTGWSAETNCSLSATSPSKLGSECLQMSSSASGDMSARTSPNDQILVEALKRYRATAYFRPASSLRSVRVEINWRDSAGASISSSVGTSVVETGTLDWTFAEVDAAAPSNAVYGTVRLTVLATGAASEVHRADFMTFARSY